MAVRNPLGKLFGQSPIRPIQEHMERVHAAAAAIVPFLEAADAGDWKQARTIQRDIARHAREADKLKKFVRTHMQRSLLLPVSRTDLLELVGMQDEVAHCARDISELVLGRKMAFPETLDRLLMTYAESSVATTAQARSAIQELDELLETGFRGREIELVSGMIDELDRLESTSDKLKLKIRGALFRMESSLPPVEVMFLYRVIDRIGDLADSSARVGHRLQLVIA